MNYQYQVERLLYKIKKGITPLIVEGNLPEDIYCGNVVYKTQDNWTIVVFNDCNYWDYIDHLIAPNGDFILLDEFQPLKDYEISEYVAHKRYFFPIQPKQTNKDFYSLE